MVHHRYIPIHPSPESPFSRLWGISREGTSGHLPEPRRKHNSGTSDNQMLTICHVNDVHNRILDPNGASPLTAVGLEVRRRRQSGHPVLFLSAGDDHIGSQFDALVGERPEDFRMSPAYRVYSDFSMDAAVLGNHDLDVPRQVLAMAVQQDARFPVLSANIHIRGLQQYEALLGDIGALSIAVIGLSTLDELHITEDPYGHVRFEDPAEAALRLGREVEDRCDLIIWLSHLGIPEPDRAFPLEFDDFRLAELAASKVSTPGVIIGGHTHTATHTPLHFRGIPIIQAGSQGEYLGVTTVRLDQHGGGLSCTSSLIPVSSLHTDSPSEQSVNQKLIAPMKRMLQKVMEQPAGRVNTDGTAATPSTLHDRLSGESSVLNAVTDAMLSSWHRWVQDPGEHYDHAVAASDTAGITGGFDREGALQVSDVYRIMPYSDMLCWTIVSGKVLLDILRSNCSRIIPQDELESSGGTIGLLDWKQVARGFLQFSFNLRFTIDVRGTAPRLEEAFADGIPLIDAAEDRFLLLMNAHPAMGHQGWGSGASVDMTSLGFCSSGVSVRTVLIHAFRNAGTTAVRKDMRLRVLYPR